jgi:hypothetical protein
LQEHLEFFHLVDVAHPSTLQRRPGPMAVYLLSSLSGR